MIRKSREIRAVVLLMIYSTSVDMLTENRWAVRFLKLDDLVFNAHFITDINTPTPVGCAYYCGQNIQCRSFFYSKTYQSCRLHNATVFSRDDGVQALSWTFYVFGHINCPIDEGFISYNADLCVYLAINSSFTFADGQKYCGEKMSNVISLQTNAKRNAFKDLMNTLMENSDLHPLIYHQQFLLNTQVSKTISLLVREVKMLDSLRRVRFRTQHGCST